MLTEAIIVEGKYSYGRKFIWLYQGIKQRPAYGSSKDRAAPIRHQRKESVFRPAERQGFRPAPIQKAVA